MTPAQFTDARILMVDDQEDNLHLLDDILDSGGYVNRRGLTDPRQVAVVFQEYQPDLVLLDLMMPYLDGVAVMEQLRSLIPAEAYLPILVVTADVTREARRRALSAGAKDFVTKPLDEDEVLLRINNLLETRFLYLSQQRRAAAQISRLERDLRELTENLPLVLWMLSGDGTQTLYVNRAYEKLWGSSCTSLQAARASWQERIHPEDHAAVASDWQRVLRGERATLTYRLTMPDRSIRFVRDACFPITDESGKVLRIVGFAEDVTDARRLEDQFRQAQKMEAFGQLAGGVAHDFNNLLTAINGFSDMILGGMVPADKHKEMVGEIRKAGERAASLTRQLLAFSRRQVLQPVPLDLNGLVQELQKMLRRLIGDDIELATDLDPALVLVKADPGQIEQVIMNLAVNARDAMPTGGRLAIQTRLVNLTEADAPAHPTVAPGHYVLLAVTDTGCGMTDDVKAHIFEPFFTTKGFGKGTGLGLAVVDGIVRQSGGFIEVESAMGAGTTLRIYLPRLEEAVPSGKSFPGLSKMPRGTETILLVDDDDVVRETARLSLESAGYTVLQANSGDDAMLLCQQHKGQIHLLLSDVVMPRMSGRQLADLVHALRPEAKVLFMSGYTDDALVRHGVEENSVAFLHKPLTPLTLIRKVREVLDGSSEGAAPTEASRSEASRSEASRSEASRSEGKLILIADDDALTLESVGHILQSHGYRVLTALDGAEAVAQVTAHGPEVAGALIDMVMPRLDGAATIKALRRIHPDLKIIVISGRVGPEAASPMAHAFVPKPINAAGLLATMQAVLKGV